MRSSTYKTARLELRCTALELEKWRCLAKQYNISLSELVRVLLHESEAQVSTERVLIESQVSRSESRLSAKHVMSDAEVSIKRAINEAQLRLIKVSPHIQLRADPLLIRQISAIGNNLNQIAHWVNTHKSQAEVRLVEGEIAKIRETLEALLIQNKDGEMGNDNASESV